MLYTGKGDDGTTSLFGCSERLSKGAKAIEALGTLDELNAMLGWCKMESATEPRLTFSAERGGDKEELTLKRVLGDIQQDLFLIQAELAGADKKIELSRKEWLEFVIANVEKYLPPIHSFIVPGGTRISALLDVSRTIARRAERRLIETREEGKGKVSDSMVGYLNRLSSTLFALARLVNAKAAIDEESPKY